jgi:hypothetical protein
LIYLAVYFVRLSWLDPRRRGPCTVATREERRCRRAATRNDEGPNPLAGAALAAMTTLPRRSDGGSGDQKSSKPMVWFPALPTVMLPLRVGEDA